MKIFYYYKINLNNNLNIDFAYLLKKCLKLLKTKKILVELVWIDEKSNQIKDLVDKCKKKISISSIINYFTLLPKFMF